MKEWAEPQLTILVRGKNEEDVLTACKVDVGAYQGASGKFSMCMPVATDCYNCDANSLS